MLKLLLLYRVPTLPIRGEILVQVHEDAYPHLTEAPLVDMGAADLAYLFKKSSTCDVRHILDRAMAANIPLTGTYEDESCLDWGYSSAHAKTLTAAKLPVKACTIKAMLEQGATEALQGLIDNDYDLSGINVGDVLTGGYGDTDGLELLQQAGRLNLTTVSDATIHDLCRCCRAELTFLVKYYGVEVRQRCIMYAIKTHCSYALCTILEHADMNFKLEYNALYYVLCTGNYTMINMALHKTDLAFADNRDLLMAVQDPVVQTLVKRYWPDIVFDDNASITVKPLTDFIPRHRRLSYLQGPSSLQSFELHGRVIWLFGDVHEPCVPEGLSGENVKLHKFLRELADITSVPCDMLFELKRFDHRPVGTRRQELPYVCHADGDFSSNLDDVHEEFSGCAGSNKEYAIHNCPNTRFHNVDFRNTQDPRYDTWSHLNYIVLAHVAGVGTMYAHTENWKTPLTKVFKLEPNIKSFIQTFHLFPNLLDGVAEGNMNQVARNLNAILAPIASIIGATYKSSFTAQELHEHSFFPKVAKQLNALKPEVRESIIQTVHTIWAEKHQSELSELITLSCCTLDLARCQKFCATLRSVLITSSARIMDLYAMARMAKIIYNYEDSRLLVVYAGQAHTKAYAQCFTALQAAKMVDMGRDKSSADKYRSCLPLNDEWQTVMQQLEVAWATPRAATQSVGYKVKHGYPRNEPAAVAPPPAAKLDMNNFVQLMAVKGLEAGDLQMARNIISHGLAMTPAMLRAALKSKNYTMLHLLVMHVPRLVYKFAAVMCEDGVIDFEFCRVAASLLRSQRIFCAVYTQLCRLFVNTMPLSLDMMQLAVRIFGDTSNLLQEMPMRAEYLRLLLQAMPAAIPACIRLAPLAVLKEAMTPQAVTSKQQMCAIVSEYDSVAKLAWLQQPLCLAVVADLEEYMRHNRDNVTRMLRYTQVVIEAGADMETLNTLFAYMLSQGHVAEVALLHTKGCTLPRHDLVYKVELLRPDKRAAMYSALSL